ncbi:hypothetical protein CYMTET_45818, partial [Cymbomonas tetramitiformis]
MTASPQECGVQHAPSGQAPGEQAWQATLEVFKAHTHYQTEQSLLDVVRKYLPHTGTHIEIFGLYDLLEFGRDIRLRDPDTRGHPPGQGAEATCRKRNAEGEPVSQHSQQASGVFAWGNVGHSLRAYLQ